MSKLLISIMLSGAFLLAGCGKPKQVVSSDPVCLEFATEQMMAASKTALEKMHFTLEKDDPQSGYLRTRPLSGAQFFQFWRQDNADSYTSAQANIHSLRRVVEMEFSEKDTTVCMNCRVTVQRLSIPEKPLEGRMLAAAAFTDSDYNTQSLMVDQDQLEKMEWLDAGPDRALEQRILKRIQKELQEITQR